MSASVTPTGIDKMSEDASSTDKTDRPSKIRPAEWSNES